MNEQPLIYAGQETILSILDETRFAPNGIVSRTLLRTAYTRVVLFGFAEGQELTEHTSTQHAVIQVLSGECEFQLAGKPNRLKAGDMLYMPPHLPHAVRATKQFSMLLTLSKPEPVAHGQDSTKMKTPNTTERPMDADKVMDVRSIPCSIKHGLIIKQWLELAVGDHFILLNDHDPVPLHHQFTAQWPDAFTWQHLVKDSDEFRIKITKLKPAATVDPVAECCGRH